MEIDEGKVVCRMMSSSTILSRFLGKATNIRLEQIFQQRQDDELEKRKTHIVCTIGPSSWDVDKLVEVCVLFIFFVYIYSRYIYIYGCFMLILFIMVDLLTCYTCMVESAVCAAI